MKNNKKNRKETLNDGILVFGGSTTFGGSQGLRYPISSNFYFWSISIRVLYQKLWPFKVFRSKIFETLNL